MTRDDVCAHCGESYRAGRPACPHCGSDAETGWGEDAEAGSAFVVPDEFTEEDYLAAIEGLPGAPEASRFLTQRQFVNLAVGLLVVLALLLFFAL